MKSKFQLNINRFKGQVEENSSHFISFKIVFITRHCKRLMKYCCHPAGQADSINTKVFECSLKNKVM